MEPASIGLGVVFVAGVVSFLSPCVLPLVPGYVSMMAGRSATAAGPDGRGGAGRLAMLGYGLAFVAGFSVVFIALGASATALGQLLRAYRFEANLLAGGLVALFGLHMAGLLRLGWLMREWRVPAMPSGGGPTGAGLMGMAFGFGWTPCIGPILGSILAAGAVAADVKTGVTLLSVYALGLAIPFLLVAVFTDALVARLRRLRKAGALLHRTAGIILILAGIGMMTGTINRLGTWLLVTFPGLGDLVI